MPISIELSLPPLEVVRLLSDTLGKMGLQVTRSFDLQSARQSLADPENCPCPFHGTARCACQYLVLLVGQGGRQPVTLVAHGHENWAEIALVEPADGSIDEELRTRVITELRRLAPAAINRESSSPT